MRLAIVILAAGEGTRMKSDLPKVMHTLAGRPMIHYVVDEAQRLDPAELVVVVGHGAEKVREVLGNGIDTATQSQRLGTGHALLQAAGQVAGRAEAVLVLYGDTPLIREEPLRQLTERHEGSGATVTLLTFRPDDPSGYGRIVRDQDTGRIRAIVEDAEATPDQRLLGEVNSGVLCFRDDWLWPNLGRIERRPGGEIYLTDLVEMACQQGEVVEAQAVANPWDVMGLDNRLKLAQAEGEMRRRINERWMLSGVTLIDPEATYIEADVEIGSDTVIWPNTFLRGRTRVGSACRIGPGTVIVDSSIGDRCRVELSVVEQAIMERDSDVGPFGHLRKGAHLGPGAHMGNFGELKNSYLGPRAKMGHMSYLGDATVGAEANIGAGTITCNYDGERKHPTTIGDGAFIGSDTMLVAPVTVGAGAKTGAGSVVTRDVPAGSLAYGVPARVRVPEGSEAAEVEQRDHA